MTNISLGWSINNMITYFVPNYFRKYFLLLAFLSLSQQPAQAIEIKFSWILGSLCTVVKSYLPTFSLPSFLAKYHFRRRNIEEQNDINNEVNIGTNIQNVKQEPVETSISSEKKENINENIQNISQKIEHSPEPSMKPHDSKPHETLLNILEISPESSFDQKKDKTPKTTPKKKSEPQITVTLAEPSPRKTTSRILKKRISNESIIKSIQEEFVTLSDEIKRKSIEYHKQDSPQDSLPKYGITPLGEAMYNSLRCGFHNEDILDRLYKSGALLTDIDNQANSVFHYLIGVRQPRLQELITSIITYTTEDNIKKPPLQNSAMLPETRFSGDDANKVAQLLKKQQNHANFHILCSVMNKLIRIQMVLQHPNKNNATPLQLLHRQYGKNHIKSVENSFNIDRPRKDFIKFIKVFPDTDEVPKDNWAGIAYLYLLKK